MGQMGSSLFNSSPASLPTIRTDLEDESRIQESAPPIINPLNDGEREKYYYFGRNNSQRKKFHYCGDCPYRACHWTSLMNHTIMIHPTSTTALPVSSMKALKISKGKSGLLNNKSITIKTLNGRHCSAKLSSSQYEYQANFPHRMKRHQVLHQRKFDLECSHLRSYSAKRKRDDYSPIEKSNQSIVNQSPPVPQATLIRKCAECEYETKFKGPFECHRMYHDKKFAHQCPWCSYSVRSLTRLTFHMKLYHTKTDKKAIANENQANLALKKDTKEWYYFRGGRMSYKNCGDCDFKTTKNKRLIAHIKLMHPSSTPTLEPPARKKEKYHLHCALCPYSTDKKFNLKRHVTGHRDQFAEHQCHLCSFSVNNRGSLALHLKSHYWEMDENNNDKNFGDQLDIGKDRGNKSAAGSSRSGQGSLLSCRDCRLFKTSSHFTLKRHAKRAHPFSLSALPTLSNKRRKKNHDLKKSDLKVAQEAHQQPIEDPSCSSPEGEIREEWCAIPSASHVLAIPAQEFKESRVTRRHPPDRDQELSEKEVETEEDAQMETHLIGQKEKRGNRLHKCLECDYSTSHAGNMKRHKNNHYQNGKFKCSSCSFSANTRAPIVFHLKYGHHQNLKSAQIQEVRSEARLRKQFAIKECSVVLHNILSPVIKVLNLENEEEDEIQLLEIRLKTMEERARIAGEEVNDISSKKMNVQKRIDEIEGRRALIEFLQSQQSSLLERSNAEKDGLFMKPVKEKVSCLEDEMKLITGKLNALKEEEKSLAQDLKYAQESYFGVVQVIEALQYELDGY